MAGNKMSKKLKIIIAILCALLILSVGALVANVIYLNFIKDNSSTMVVPDNLIGDDKNISATPDGSDTNSSTVEEGSNIEQPSESTKNETTISGGSSTSDSTTDEDDNSEKPNETTENETDVPESSLSSENDENGGTTSSAETKATVIELYKGQPSDNEKFQVTNMLPGDTEVKYFAVKVNHHADVIVYFSAEVTEQTKNLANVLHIKITRLENGSVIYDGSFADMDSDGYGELFATDEETETIAYYKIEVSLPTTATNEYQAAKLLADFDWKVSDAEILDPPQTGDNSNITLYFAIMCISFAMILVLLFTKRREREVDESAR